MCYDRAVNGSVRDNEIGRVVRRAVVKYKKRLFEEFIDLYVKVD